MENSVIKYQSTTIINLDTACFDAPILSHTYVDGYGRIEFEGNLTRVGENAFFDNTNLISITLPDSLLEIAANAFCRCKGLQEVYVGNQLQCIGQSAFAQCTNLAHIVLPDSVTSIGANAFCLCWELKSLSIPKGVTKIEEWTFNAAGFTHLTIPDNIQEIGYRAFAHTHIVSLVVPGTLKRISEIAFWNCKKLEEVKICNGVEVISRKAFSECINLKKVDMGETVELIDEQAFEECTSLEGITIPRSVKEIKWRAFNKCPRLADVAVPNDTVIDEQAFNCHNINRY